MYLDATIVWKIIAIERQFAAFAVEFDFAFGEPQRVGFLQCTVGDDGNVVGCVIHHTDIFRCTGLYSARRPRQFLCQHNGEALCLCDAAYDQQDNQRHNVFSECFHIITFYYCFKSFNHKTLKPFNPQTL